MFMPCILVN